MATALTAKVKAGPAKVTASNPHLSSLEKSPAAAGLFSFHGSRRATITPVIRELLEARAGEDYDLYARTINPQFMRVLRTIGFDRVWSRTEGQYLYDAEGN